MRHLRDWVGFTAIGMLALSARHGRAEPTASFDVTPAPSAAPPSQPPPAATVTTTGAPPAPPPGGVAEPTARTAPLTRVAPPAPLPQSIEESRAPAPAAPAERFGDAGQWVITAGFDAWFSYTTGGSNSRTDVYVHPDVDYFVAQHFSIGAELAFRYTNDDYAASTTTTLVGGGVLLGYDVRLGERVSLWPRASLGYSAGHVKYEYSTYSYYGYPTVGTAESDTHGVTTSFSLPLLVHPVPHFFIGGGPQVAGYFPTDDSSADPTLSVTVGMILGGWF